MDNDANLTIYKQIRQEIHYEHAQIGNRMQWFTASQAFLAAAWALLTKSLLERATTLSVTIPPTKLFLSFFLALIPALGIVLSFTSWISVRAAIAKLKWLRNTREIEHVKSEYYMGSLLAHDEMPRWLRYCCRRDAVDKCGLLYPGFIPWVLLFFWSVVLCFSIVFVLFAK
jgi:hypothetical protein